MQPLPMSAAPIATSPSSTTTTATGPALSRALSCWLLDETSDAKAIEVIAKSDLLRSEATMAMPALRAAALRPASPDEIRAIIGSRFPTYPQPKRTEGEAAAFWADYFDALEGLTPAMIEAGMAAHVKDPKAEFLPKPGRLAELAKTTPTTGRFTRAYNRARSAVVANQKAAEPKPAVEERPSPEEVKAMVAETLAALAETPTAKALAARKQAMKPTPSAPLPAGSHMSAEMRAKLETRKAIQPRYDLDQYGEAA